MWHLPNCSVAYCVNSFQVSWSQDGFNLVKGRSPTRGRDSYLATHFNITMKSHNEDLLLPTNSTICLFVSNHNENLCTHVAFDICNKIPDSFCEVSLCIPLLRKQIRHGFEAKGIHQLTSVVVRLRDLVCSTPPWFHGIQQAHLQWVLWT